uniref:Probable 3-oxoacyl-[acyl-carrier-protein] reductase oxidoreductase (EC) n=1 Tax=Ganoderma boninense TaxID=34458 RepID=A0A5K1K2A6_9APHY|nr:Probable 3-oxoacyl-[acyl-carrier-protein] reductase oxidoreductase (EC [Ganoderma boninense]
MSASSTASTPRVAIVTGAAQGIGEAIALRLADDRFNLVVVGTPRNPERLDAVVKAIEEKGRRAIAFTGDVSLEADVAALVNRTVQEFGGVDVVRSINSSAYVASKFAIRGLAQCVALELREHKITVNTVAPGLIVTKMALHPDDEKNGGRFEDAEVGLVR